MFNSPTDCSIVDDGSILVADSGNHCIRRIAASLSGELKVHTICGGAKKGFCNGSGTSCLFRSPQGLCTLKNGDILVADTLNNCIRRICKVGTDDSSNAWVALTMTGQTRPGHRDGPCGKAMFNQPTGICLGSDGTILVADRGNNCIRQIVPQSSNDVHDWVRTIDVGDPAPSRFFPKGVEPPFCQPRGVCALSSKYSWYNGLKNGTNAMFGVADSGNVRGQSQIVTCGRICFVWYHCQRMQRLQRIKRPIVNRRQFKPRTVHK